MSLTAAQHKKFASRLFAVAEPRIFYLFIPKCGCTYVKNVLWHIASGEPYANPLRIHDSDALVPRSDTVVEDYASIRREPLAFSVLRNPVDRFLSLYLDKVVGAGRSNFVPLFDTLVALGRIKPNPTSLSDHHANLFSLVDWLEENLSGDKSFQRNAHWTPQSDRALVMRTFNLKILTVEKLSLGLHILLRDAVPEIERILLIAEKNRSTRAVAKSDLLTRGLRRKVNELYSEDRALFRRAASAWKLVEERKWTSAEVPRFSEIEGD